MKKLTFTLIVFALSVTLGYSQWTTNVNVNTLIQDSSGTEQSVPMTAPGLNGQTYISWFDMYNGQYQLKMQLLDSNGVAQWAANGLVVSNHPQNSALYRYDLSSDNEGNAIVAFQDERTGSLQVVAYKISPAGNFVWGPDGIVLKDSVADDGMAPVIGVAGNNDVMIAWTASGTSKWISFMRINSTGTLLWPTVKRINTSGFKFSRPSMIATRGDKIIMQYVQESGSFPGVTSTMYADCYNADGSSYWPAPIQISTKTISFWFFPKIQPDQKGGFYLIFTTSNPQATTLNDVFVQHMDSTGVTWSATGTEAADSLTHKLTAGGCFNPQTHEYFALLQVLNSSQGNSGIYLQKFDEAGNKLLGNNGLIIIPISPVYYLPYTINKVNGGLIIVYKQGTSGETLYSVKTDYNGVLVWPAPVGICTAAADKDDLSTLNISDYQLAIVWMDERLDMGIYAQNISFNGYPGIITGIPENDLINGLAVYPNPGTCQNVVFDNPKAGSLKLSVYDLQGRLVISREIEVQAGTNYFNLDTEALQNGSYILNILTDSQTITRKLIVQ